MTDDTWTLYQGEWKEVVVLGSGRVVKPLLTHTSKNGYFVRHVICDEIDLNPVYRVVDKCSTTMAPTQDYPQPAQRYYATDYWLRGEIIAALKFAERRRGHDRRQTP